MVCIPSVRSGMRVLVARLREWFAVMLYRKPCVCACNVCKYVEYKYVERCNDAMENILGIGQTGRP